MFWEYALFKIEKEKQKCPDCERFTDALYLLASSQENAEKLHKTAKSGLCADCTCEGLVYSRYTVVTKKLEIDSQNEHQGA